MNEALIRLGEQLKDEMRVFVAAAIPEMNGNEVFGRCEILVAFTIESFNGVLASMSGGAPMGVIRSARGLFETYIDSCLVLKADNPADALKDMYDYAHLEQAKYKRILKPKYKSTALEAAAEEKFANPTSKNANKKFKHWSRIETVEERVKAAGQGMMYDTFYRVASFATHGSPSFIVLYQSKSIFTVERQFFQMSIGLAVDAIGNCLEAGNVQDTALLESYRRMVAIREQVTTTISSPTSG